MHQKKLKTSGKKIGEAGKVLIMVHGRGASAGDILTLVPHFNLEDFAIVAPEATNNSWYPFSFMAPRSQNEPWLTSALSMMKELLDDIVQQGVDPKNIYFLGFSQGACLVLEFVASNATRFGGVAAFTGGLIGERVDPARYKGDFKGTTVFIGTSDPDPHVPVERVHASTTILENMNARVTQKVYSNMGHTINKDEIDTVNNLLFASSPELQN